jgi:hypothetical protein
MPLIDVGLERGTTTTRAVKHRRNEVSPPPPKPDESIFYDTIHLARNALYCLDLKMAMFRLNEAASIFANLPVGVQERVMADNPGLYKFPPLGDWGAPSFVAFWLLRIAEQEGAFPNHALPERGAHCPPHARLVHDT